MKVLKKLSLFALGFSLCGCISDNYDPNCENIELQYTFTGNHRYHTYAASYKDVITDDELIDIFVYRKEDDGNFRFFLQMKGRQKFRLEEGEYTLVFWANVGKYNYSDYDLADSPFKLIARKEDGGGGYAKNMDPIYFAKIPIVVPFSGKIYPTVDFVQAHIQLQIFVTDEKNYEGTETPRALPAIRVHPLPTEILFDNFTNGFGLIDQPYQQHDKILNDPESLSDYTFDSRVAFGDLETDRKVLTFNLPFLKEDAYKGIIIHVGDNLNGGAGTDIILNSQKLWDNLSKTTPQIRINLRYGYEETAYIQILVNGWEMPYN
ncbi:hypothetical protein AGMMS49982_18710 [Bacteroidia bacterium]|nr:hypothetical protein AGMMS49982_18710 [Bacteroidia bacterium]